MERMKRLMEVWLANDDIRRVLLDLQDDINHRYPEARISLIVLCAMIEVAQDSMEEWSKGVVMGFDEKQQQVVKEIGQIYALKQGRVQEGMCGIVKYMPYDFKLPFEQEKARHT